MKRNLILFALIFVFGFLNVSAQIETSAPVKSSSVEGKSISRGVLNGSATSLAKPSYPAAARAVGAEGAVNVQVTIDENGDVISATAISGHPLLQQASVQAARASKFSPTLLQGQPVRVTGVIVYNFLMPLTFTQIGYELSLAEKSKFLNRFRYSSMGASFPQNWVEEKEDLKNIDSYLTSKDIKGEILQPIPKVATDKSASMYKGLTVKGSVATDSATSIDGYKLDSESIEIIRQLQSKIENRLSPNEKLIWSFKLGMVLGDLRGEFENSEKTQANLTALNQLGQNAPSGISDLVLMKIKEITESAQQSSTDTDANEKLKTQIENLRNIRGY